MCTQSTGTFVWKTQKINVFFWIYALQSRGYATLYTQPISATLVGGTLKVFHRTASYVIFFFALRGSFIELRKLKPLRSIHSEWTRLYYGEIRTGKFVLLNSNFQVFTTLKARKFLQALLLKILRRSVVDVEICKFATIARLFTLSFKIHRQDFLCFASRLFRI